ncbi:LamG-like jellyroll fold domain-containing protein [Aquimarina litoralis]|uniref:LamG-like jellyroll fold domain-containing protein n=1 Tax=Aquimarina litoralis TaxID=584605 RepID=UPI001C58F6AC|nr:LamG-like jellyroll fold domain-containing protein [Aquimarina litoralis]MBW1295097.1 hypothetical protein [Aquimarina litoralis]
MKTIKLLLLSLFIITSCTNDDDNMETIIIVSDFSVTTNENPSEGQILGTIDASTNQGTLTFSITSQTPAGAMDVNSITGEVSVLNSDLFDIKANLQLTATVEIKNGNVTEIVMVTVNLITNCVANEPTLLAYYPMDSNSNDTSGFNNNGVVNGAVLTNDRFSNTDAAYYFDGVDDDISISDNNQIRLTNEFTISAWVFPEEIKSQVIMRKGSFVNGIFAVPYGLSMSATNDIIFSMTTDGNLTQVRKSGYNINQWYLISGVFKDQTMYLYINDELVAIETVEGQFNYNDSPLLIGTRLNLPSSTFKGAIDDVRIYNRALCTEEIIELYEN